ncbi:MAG: hypothetical protein FJY81_02900 [Candidatus Aminicenantes bacterium]|nr:hypothetical protein [Candidatus Aminicenantes bacterium]
MAEFFEAKSLTEDERKKLAQEIERRIAERMKAGLLTEREIREIEEMRLKPLPDIQDVQDVYENHLFRNPDKTGEE